jgi:flagellar hook-associated protein 2
MGITSTATSALSNLLSSGGIGTGLNVQALVSQTIQADSGPLIQLQNLQSSLNAQTSALNKLNSELSTLLTAVQNLSDFTGGLNALQASSSDSSIVTGTADTTAQQGVHTLVVSSLATTGSYYTAEQASSTTPLATGASFTIQVGTGTPVSITIDSTNNTLAGLAQAINDANAGVTASLITDSTGVRLAVVSNTSGAAGDVTISDPGNATGLSFTKAVTGNDASFTVDGIPISSASNTVTGVIQGLTLDLVSADPGKQVTLNVQPDQTQATAAITQFVNAYNAVIGDLNSQFTVDSSTGNAGVLSSDSTARLAQEQLFTAVNFSTGGSVANLASLGINLQNDGTLQVDNSTLSAAFTSNHSAVIDFFQNTTSSLGQAFTTALNNLTDPTQGAVSLDLQGIAQEQSSLTDQISQVQYKLEQEQAALVVKYSQVNAILQQLPVLQEQISQQLAGA